MRSEMKQHSTKELQELSDEDLRFALIVWEDEEADLARSPFRLERARRMIDRIRREYERRGL